MFRRHPVGTECRIVANIDLPRCTHLSLSVVLMDSSQSLAGLSLVKWLIARLYLPHQAEFAAQGCQKELEHLPDETAPKTMYRKVQSYMIFRQCMLQSAVSPCTAASEKTSDQCLGMCAHSNLGAWHL